MSFSCKTKQLLYQNCKRSHFLWFNASLKDPTSNFKFKNCSIGAASIVKSSDKEKYVSSGYGITFDLAGSCSFDEGTARNVIVFGVDNSSLSHADNLTSLTSNTDKFTITVSKWERII